jgi:hypothetical protein
LHGGVSNCNIALQIVYAGGNLTHEGSILAQSLTEILGKKFPKAEILGPKVPASVAAAMLARQLTKETQ